MRNGTLLGFVNLKTGTNFLSKEVKLNRLFSVVRVMMTYIALKIQGNFSSSWEVTRA